MFEYVGSNKTSSVAIFTVNIQDEELHLVLLHNVGVEEGESDYGSEFEFFEDNHAVLYGDAAQTTVWVFEDIAHATVEFGAGEDDGTAHLYHKGSV